MHSRWASLTEGRTTTQLGYGWAWEKRKKRILVRDFACGICGEDGLPNDTVDHIVPKHLGGTDDDENLRRAHKRCHEIKSGREGRRSRAV